MESLVICSQTYVANNQLFEADFYVLFFSISAWIFPCKVINETHKFTHTYTYIIIKKNLICVPSIFIFCENTPIT